MDNQRYQLQSGDYRPLQPGDKGYSKTSRRMYSPSLQKSISWHQFRKQATRVAIPTKAPTTTKPTATPVQKARKPRADKGMDRGTYKLVKAELDARKRYEQEQRRKEKAQKRVQKKPLTLDVAKNRYEAAKQKHNERINEQRATVDLPPIDINTEPEERAFYDTYDVIKHPDRYTRAEVDAAHDYFWGDDYDQDYEYDYPDGETP